MKGMGVRRHQLPKTGAIVMKSTNKITFSIPICKIYMYVFTHPIFELFSPKNIIYIIFMYFILFICM